jgi:class 3 adenylate cyclase
MFFFLVCSVLLVLGAYFNETADRRSFLYRQMLLGERDRLEQVLQNVLPAPIAERLKHSREVIAEYHPSATVLFADVVDFTPFAASKEPGEVVGFLNEVFSRFDALVEDKGLEKIKTVGDAYMVAAGLPMPRADHLQAMADLALEMRGVASALGVKMRIGLHCGPVIAGVIGTKKYLYDLWGDTVNTASRMESHGVPGEIQMTQATADALGKDYEVAERGEIPVKGMGVAKTYLLVRKKAPSLAVEARV